MTQIFNKRSQIIKRKLLRRNTPLPENILWQALRNRKISGQKFKRQFSIGRYVVDFYCPSLRLVIEIDGPYHIEKHIKEYDLERHRFVESLGLHCLHFKNKDIEENASGVIDKINSFFFFLRTLFCFQVSISSERSNHSSARRKFGGRRALFRGRPPAGDFRRVRRLSCGRWWDLCWKDPAS